MKKALIIIIPIVLVLLIAGSVAVYFIWQSFSKGSNNSGGNTATVTVTANPGVAEDSGEVENEACALLTLSIAKQVLGSDAVLASQNSGNCTYSSESEFGVLVIVVSKSDVLTARTQYEAAKSTVYENNTTAVTGLNVDEAYFANGMAQLSMLKGDSWIIISGTSAKYTNEKDLAVATARLVF